MKKKIIISVIMSVYDVKISFLEKSINSILKQTYKQFEFIIVNDNAPHHIKKYLNKFKKKDSRIKLINNKINLGLAKSLNKAIKASKGKYIARMDSDDVSLPRRLHTQLNFMKKNKDIDLIGSNSYIINYDNKIISQSYLPLKFEDIKKSIFKFNPIVHPTVLAKKKFFIKNLYNINYKKCQDYELWMRSISTHKFLNLKSKLIFYRQGKKNFYDFYYALKIIIKFGIEKKNYLFIEGIIRLIFSMLILKLSK